MCCAACSNLLLSAELYEPCERNDRAARVISSEMNGCNCSGALQTAASAPGLHSCLTGRNRQVLFWVFNTTLSDFLIWNTVRLPIHNTGTQAGCWLARQRWGGQPAYLSSVLLTIARYRLPVLLSNCPPPYTSYFAQRFQPWTGALLHGKQMCQQRAGTSGHRIAKTCPLCQAARRACLPAGYEKHKHSSAHTQIMQSDQATRTRGV